MMVPHDTIAGRRDRGATSVVSDRIASATVRIVLAKMTGITFGRMCRVIDVPVAGAERSSPLHVGPLLHGETWARTSRAVPAHDVSPMIRMMIPSVGPKIDGEHDREREPRDHQEPVGETHQRQRR